MRTRFIKRWCDVCASMQFAGECGHGLIIRPTNVAIYEAATAERKAPPRLRDIARSAMDLLNDEMLRDMGLQRIPR